MFAKGGSEREMVTQNARDSDSRTGKRKEESYMSAWANENDKFACLT